MSEWSCIRLCAHVCPYAHTQTRTVGFTNASISLKAVFSPYRLLSFHFFLSFFLFLSLYFFWYFKAGSSGNGWNCHISVLAKEINANPITGSYHLSQNSQLKEKKHTLRCQSKKKKRAGRRVAPFIRFQIVIVFSLFFLIIFFPVLEEKPNYKTPVLTQHYQSDLKLHESEYGL